MAERHANFTSGADHRQYFLMPRRGLCLSLTEGSIIFADRSRLQRTERKILRITGMNPDDFRMFVGTPEEMTGELFEQLRALNRH